MGKYLRNGALFSLSVLVVLLWANLGVSQTGGYAGSEACAECHEDEYETFESYAKKSHSYKSIKIMESDLSPEEVKECYSCHTTGYGEPGGFVSISETPHLANAGCEVCHGPGVDHIESGGDAELIKGDLSIEDCETCHNEERVSSFNFKPLPYGGAH